MRVKKHILTIITAAGLGLTFGWGFGGHEAKAQEAKKKEMKTKEEFDLYEAYMKAAPKDKPAALDKWKAGYPQSDFVEDRETFYLNAYNDIKDIRKAFDKAAEILKTRPNFPFALQTILSLAPQLNPILPADLDTAERVAKHILDDSSAIFSVANKPDAAMKDEQWAGMKQPFTLAAQRTYAWVFVQRKDYPKAEIEVTKYLQMDPTQATFSYFLAQALLAQNKEHPEKAPPALYHFARAAAYDGPNAVDAVQRKTFLDYVTNRYREYHCSDEGFAQLLATAKTVTFPPAGFNIKSCTVIAQEKAEAQAAEDAKNPLFAFWRDVLKKPLLEDPAFWSGTVEGALLPGEAGKAKDISKFEATLISQNPATKPKQLVLGLADANVPDITLVFEEALPGSMEPGSKLKFEGVAKGFTKEPFMLTLEVEKEQLIGWEGKNTPAKGGAKQPAKGPAKAPATKAPATKGKATK